MIVGVETISSQAVSAYEDACPWGEAGSYELVRGVAEFAVDPDAAVNHPIIDLTYAERGQDGKVRFDADFRLLRPASSDAANRRLLFVVPNRGMTFNVPMSKGAGSGFGDDLERIGP